MDKWLLMPSTSSNTQRTLTPIPLIENVQKQSTSIESENQLNVKISALETSDKDINSNSDYDTENETVHPVPSKGRKVIQSNKKYRFCPSWLNIPEFKNWLTESNSLQKNGFPYVKCKICGCDILPHKGCIKRHGDSAKHKFNWEQVCQNSKLTDLYKSTSLEDNVQRAEIELCGLLAVNNLPFILMDTLSPLLTKIFPDSQIAKKLSVKRTKATTIISENLGKAFLNSLYDELKQPGSFFSIVMDETTDISVKKQCAFTIIHYKNYKVKTSFFDLIETEGGGADDLFKALKNVITSKNIPFTNLIGFSSDTTNVMVGNYHSVFFNLKNELPDIVCVKCSCHMAHLAASKACLKLPRSVEDLIRNLGSHFSRSAIRRKKFEEFQKFFHTEIHKVLTPATTRWLSVRQCVDRVLEQYEPLKTYLRELLFTDPSVTTESMINTMENSFTKLYLEFMSYTLGLLTEFNLLFQSEKPLLYKVKPETEMLLKTLCTNYIELTYIKNENIFKLNHKNPRYFVSLDKIYLGVQAFESYELLSHDANVNKKDLEKFLKTCLEFYIELVTNIKERFNFEDPIYDILSIVDPVVAQSFELKSLQVVIKRFPILTQYITNIQTLDNEWRMHALLQHDKLTLPESADKYWANIFQMKNAAEVEIFPNLKKVISFLLLLPFSNASVERVFSDLFNIKTDKRNSLNTSTIKYLLASKQGIEDQGGCLKFAPTKEMLNKKNWRK